MPKGKRGIIFGRFFIMNNFIVTTENTCDLTDEFLAAREVRKTSLHYYLDGVEYPSENFNAKEFYDKLRSGVKGTTSQPNAFDFETLWTPILEEGKDVLHLAFSSVLSGTYANACAVSQRLTEKYADRKIIVVDTKSQSAGQGLLVDLVSEYRLNGHSLDECCEYAESTIQKVNHIFTIDDLRCLAATGRVSNAEAFIGNLLQIKPLLYTSEEGKLTPYARVISRKAAIGGLADKVKAKFSGEKKLIYITHSDCLKDAEAVAAKLDSLGAEIRILDLNPVIGCHTGANTIAVFFLSDSRNIKG